MNNSFTLRKLQKNWKFLPLFQERGAGKEISITPAKKTLFCMQKIILEFSCILEFS
jgi:hypothetical protein